jgi:phosphatidylglycerol:prolipoprotein diacylglycerol transferase
MRVANVGELTNLVRTVVGGISGSTMGSVSGIDPVLAEIGEVRLYYYGLAYAIGLLTVHLWVGLKRRRLGLSRHEVVEFSLLFGAGVLLGGRVFDVALYEWFYYQEHLSQLPSLWRGGMATHGVLLGAVVGTALFCRLRGKSLLEIADTVVIPGAVLMALGRVGNHINGEVYGSVTDVSWAIQTPYAAGCRHPVALYDGLKNLLILPVLLYVQSRYLKRDKYPPPGLLLGHFVLWYGSLRLFVDHFREYDSYWLGIGRGQYFNLLTAAVGLGIILLLRWYASPRPEEPGGGAQRRSDVDRMLWGKRAAFYAVVSLCLTIPSGWTQQVLEEFETRAGVSSATATSCGDRQEDGLRPRRREGPEPLPHATL